MVHTTRVTNTSLLDFDPEIERTFHQAIRAARAPLQDSDTMANRVTLESLTAPNLDQPTRAVEFPALGAGVKFELKTGFIHLLPKFSGIHLKIPFNI